MIHTLVSGIIPIKHSNKHPRPFVSIVLRSIISTACRIPATATVHPFQLNKYIISLRALKPLGTLSDNPIHPSAPVPDSVFVVVVVRAVKEFLFSFFPSFSFSLSPYIIHVKGLTHFSHIPVYSSNKRH